MKITCMIVEDEPASQDILKHYIADVPDLVLTHVCSHALNANDVLAKEPVQVMFLDVNMPKLSGINFYKSLQRPPLVIFTTAYPEYAIEGFEVDAVDYLVKPFPFERFLRAVNKLRDKLQPTSPSVSDNYILLNADKKLYKVKHADVRFVEAFGDYVKVYLQSQVIIVHETMQGIQQQLPECLFARVHKSFIIALDHFQYIDGNTVMVASRSIPIGQIYRSDFLKRIQRSL
jgi:DNA-binding LytR/AlgR family response regulator